MDWTNLIKLTELNKSLDLSAAQYSLDYSKALRKYRQADNINLQILSTLIGDADVIIEFNTTLLFSTNKIKPKEDLVADFISDLKKHNINYRYRKLPTHKPAKGAFAFLLGSKDDTLHEVFAYIPNQLWLSPSFQQTLPKGGLRIYITKKPKAEKLLDDIQNMMDREKLAYFDLIIFDNKNLGTMGINTSKLDGNKLRELLKI